MLCSNCNKEIPPARLEILPETTTCVNCSTVEKRKAIIEMSPRHKSMEITIVDADDPILDYTDEKEI